MEKKEAKMMWKPGDAGAVRVMLLLITAQGENGEFRRVCSYLFPSVCGGSWLEDNNSTVSLAAAVSGSGAGLEKRVLTDPLHVEGERLPASGFRLVPAQHHVGVAHLAGVDVCGSERNSDLTCGVKGGGRKKVRSIGDI